MGTITDVLASIEAHCLAHGIAETTFGRIAVNDGKLVSRLRSGRSITLDTLTKIEAALSTSPPEQPPNDHDGEQDAHRDDGEAPALVEAAEAH